VPVALHLDHVTDVALRHQAPACGFSSVMFDASHLPYADNVAMTASAADFCHAHGLWLEGELGAIGGKDGAHAPGVRTDPAEAASFSTATHLDALAVAIGSSHAMTSRDAALDQTLIAALRDAVSVPLVLHGASGVPVDELRAAVAHGLVRINIGTALNVAYTAAVRDALQAHTTAVDPRGYLATARTAVSDTVFDTLCVLQPTEVTQ
jgi:fructose-bisphosphate aldolase class II